MAQRKYFFFCILFIFYVLVSRHPPSAGGRGWHLVLQQGANLLHCSHGDGCACVLHTTSLCYKSCNCGSLQALGIQKEGKDVLWMSSLPAPPLWMCMQDAHGKPVGRAGGYWGVVPWGDVTGSWCAKPLLVLIEPLCLELQRSRGQLSMFKLKRLQADNGQIPTHVT